MFLQIIWFMKNKYLNCKKCSYSFISFAFIEIWSIWIIWIQFETLTHVSYPSNRPNFPHVPYLIDDETWSGEDRRSKREVAAGFTFRGPLNITFAYYSFTSLPSHLEARFAFTAQKLRCFQSYLTFLMLGLFIRKAGRYTSSSLLSERFLWREKQLRAGLSGHISKLV